MAGDFYETERALSEYLLFHYGSVNEIGLQRFNQDQSLRYATRCVSECLISESLPGNARALDIGCAVGRSTFELARSCQLVVGIDYSHRFIEVANRLKSDGNVAYEFAVEGELKARGEAHVPTGVDPQRVQFEQGDAQDLRPDIGAYDVVLAANLIDRLREPRRFLARLPDLVKSNGQLILTSPYTWLEDYTPREHWLGGFMRDGKPVTTFDTLREVLEEHFILKERKDLPFLIREHARKFQWSVADATMWRRKR